MSSEYDPFPVPSESRGDGPGLDVVQELFREASMPYLSSPWSWLAWSLILPAAAFLTPSVGAVFEWMGVLLLWSGAIVVGGVFEIAAIRSAGSLRRQSALASWALGVQGNLSMVAVCLSLFLVWQSAAWALPSVWLLVLGHSFVSLGGLSFAGLRQAGLLYQLGGVVALWPGGQPLLVLAATTFVANLWMALAVRRRQRSAAA